MLFKHISVSCRRKRDNYVANSVPLPLNALSHQYFAVFCDVSPYFPTAFIPAIFLRNIKLLFHFLLKIMQSTSITSILIQNCLRFSQEKFLTVLQIWAQKRGDAEVVKRTEMKFINHKRNMIQTWNQMKRNLHTTNKTR